MGKLTAERLRELLQYNPDTGVFTWKPSPHKSSQWHGKRAGTLNSTGYRKISVDGRQYLEHRLVWLYLHGEWPKSCLDHINHQRDDNREANLRAANHSQNNGHRYNSDGCWWVESRQRYAVAVTVAGVRRWVGRFDSKDEALAARNRAKNELATELGVEVF